uniref:Reverse transcriptase domain-containing protein n=1 Tax=Biomphalaria glabrata TaxID=6526 RepID=A0A2C9M0F0_BIOGL
MREKVKKEIELLVSRKILVPVDEPTDWVSQMVVVKKTNGNLRICIDPQHLNNVLKQERYKLPTLEDILPQLKNAKIFSKLEIKEAYWHIRLDEYSSLLTTMITPFGQFRWAQLPFGLNVSGEIFQKQLAQALERLDGCINVADDIVKAGCRNSIEEAERDHDTKLKKLHQR